MEELAKRTQESALMEVHYKLQGHGKKLTECFERLKAIGNRLIDDSCNLTEQDLDKKPSNIMPGMIMNLNNDCEGFYRLIIDIDNQIKKIDPLI